MCTYDAHKIFCCIQFQLFQHMSKVFLYLLHIIFALLLFCSMILIGIRIITKTAQRTIDTIDWWICKEMEHIFLCVLRKEFHQQRTIVSMFNHMDEFKKNILCVRCANTKRRRKRIQLLLSFQLVSFFVHCYSFVQVFEWHSFSISIVIMVIVHVHRQQHNNLILSL